MEEYQQQRILSPKEFNDAVTAFVVARSKLLDLAVSESEDVAKFKDATNTLLKNTKRIYQNIVKDRDYNRETSLTALDNFIHLAQEMQERPQEIFSDIKNRTNIINISNMVSGYNATVLKKNIVPSEVIVETTNVISDVPKVLTNVSKFRIPAKRMVGKGEESAEVIKEIQDEFKKLKSLVGEQEFSKITEVEDTFCKAVLRFHQTYIRINEPDESVNKIYSDNMVYARSGRNDIRQGIKGIENDPSFIGEAISGVSGNLESITRRINENNELLIEQKAKQVRQI